MQLKPNYQDRVDLVRFRWLLLFTALFPLSGIQFNNKISSGSLNLILLVVLVLVVWILNRFSPAPDFTTRERKITAWIAKLLLLVIILSTLFSVRLGVSLIGLPGEYQGTLSLISYIALFLWTANATMRNATHARQVIWAMAYGSIIPSLYGILQHFHHIPFIPHVSRSLSLFCNADFFGAYEAFMFVLTVTLYLMASRPMGQVGPRAQTPHVGQLGQLALLALIYVQFIALIYSSTRSAWLGAVVGMVLLTGLTLRKRPVLWKRFAVLFVVLAGCLTLVSHQNHGTVITRAASVAVDAQRVVTNHQANYAGSSRWYIWKESLPLLKNYFWLGSGPDTFQFVFHPTVNGSKKYLDNQPLPNANNNYLQTALTLGFPTLMLELLLFYRVLLAAWRRWNRFDEEGVFSLGLAAAIVTYLIQAVFNIDVVMVAPFFWMVLGIGYLQFTGTRGRRGG